MELKFRANVAGIFQRKDDGRIFVGERMDVSGAWQFPQGGVDKGEDILAAFHRETEEEIGLKPSDYVVISQKGGYRYRFPKGKPMRGKYGGQEQTYFHCMVKADESAICLDAHDQEFAAYKWIYAEEFDFKAVPKFKREVYKAVMHDFFGVRA